MLKLSSKLRKIHPAFVVSTVAGVFIVSSFFPVEPLMIASFYLGGVITTHITTHNI